MKIYVIQNQEGKFFKPFHVQLGSYHTAKHWQDNIEKAKIYTKIGGAKARITYWFKHYPGFGCPRLLEFDIDPAQAKVIDMTEATTKAITKRLPNKR